MTNIVNTEAFDIIFRKSHTAREWSGEAVGSFLLKEIFDLVKLAPTSANCQPLRIIFVVSKEQKQRLLPCLAKGNIEKVIAAPVTAIFAYDTEFYEFMPYLFPHSDFRKVFAADKDKALKAGYLNASLQAAYFILAARGLGLAMGPMSGFDSEKTDKEFFANGRNRSIFLCNMGFPKKGIKYNRDPRLSFDEACQII